MDAAMLKEVKDLLTEQKTVWKQLQDEVNKLEASGKNTQKEWNEKTQKLQDKLDEIETKLSRPTLAGAAENANLAARTGDGGAMAERAAKYAKAWDAYARKGNDIELKALATDTDTAGGYTLPHNIASNIILKLIQISPIRELCDAISIAAGDIYEEPREGDTNFSSGWVAERGSRGETGEATIFMEKTPVHELYANPFITQKMLDDSAFNVEEWMTKRVVRAFEVAEGAAFVNGTGVGQPQGLLTSTAMANAPSGDANLLKADGIIDLFYLLPEYYTRNATWIMKRSTVQAIRKFKDGQGQYLWSPGFSGNLSTPVPATIMDKPYREAIDMPVVAANAYPIIFGDFKQGYRIVDRMDIRVLRDPYSNKPYISFYTTKRTGGQVILAEALVKQKVSVS